MRELLGAVDSTAPRGLRSSVRLVAIAGEPGSGKTSLVRFRVVGWKITGHGVREQKEWELLEVGVPRCMESGQHAPILVDVSLIGQPFVDQVCGGCGRQMSRRRIDL